MQPLTRPVTVVVLGSVLLAGCAQGADPDSSTSSSGGVHGTALATGTVVVTGEVSPERLAGYRADIAVGMRQVAAFWGTRWSTRSVRLVVAASGNEFAELTARPRNARIPAVTTAAGVVVVHPDLWTGTSPAGRQVVITHELTHVALGHGALTGTPLWVVEGSAEVTAYAAAGLPPREVAPGLFERVRRGEGPTGPPGDVELRDGTATSVTASYQSAWAWCTFLISLRGRAAFVDFVVRAGRTEQDVFRTTYGATPAELRDDYGRWLRASA